MILPGTSLFSINNTTEAQDDHKLRWFDVDNGVVIDISPAYEFPTFKFSVLVEDKPVTGITCNDDDDSKWDIFSIEQDEQDDTSPQYTFRSTSTSTLHSTPARQVPIHSTLQYSRLSPNFSQYLSVGTMGGTNPLDYTCKPCPVGGSCDGAVIASDVRAMFGWWQCSNNVHQ